MIGEHRGGVDSYTPALPVFLLLLKVAEPSHHRAFTYDVSSFRNAHTFSLIIVAFFVVQIPV